MMDKKICTKKKILIIVTIVAVTATIIFSAGCLGDIKPPVVPEKSIDVWFYDGNQSLSKLSITEHSSVQIPTAPAKDGYRFDGWYLDNGSWRNPFDLSSIDFGSDTGIKVYAHYVKMETPSTPTTPTAQVPTTTPTTQVPTTTPTPEPQKIKGTHYLENKPEIIPFGGVYRGTYISDKAIYVVYDIARVNSALVDVWDAVFTNPGTGKMEHSTETYDSSYIRTYVEDTISSVVSVEKRREFNIGLSANYEAGFKTSAKLSDESGKKNNPNDKSSSGVDASAGNTLNIKGEIGFKMSDVDYSETKTTSKDAEEKIKEYSKREFKKITVDLGELEKGYDYRNAVLADCMITQVFVYSFDETKNAWGWNSFLETRVIDKGQNTFKDIYFQYSHPGENFVYKNADDSGTAGISMEEFRKSYLNLSHHLNKDESTGEYLISDVSDFIQIYLHPNEKYRLESDINFTGHTLPSFDCVFTGELNGNGHTITGNSNLTSPTIKANAAYIPADESKTYGLFSVNNGVIKNLKLRYFRVLDDSEINSGGQVYAGCICGINKGTISDVELNYCEVECHRAGSSIGTVAGKNEGTIERCSVNSFLVFGYGNGGGITGTNDSLGRIISCHVVGKGIPDEKNDATYKGFRSLYYYEIAEGSDGGRTGMNGGHECSWGGIVGWNLGYVEDVDVRSLFTFSDEVDSHLNPSIGYLVGNNYHSGSVILTPENVSKIDYPNNDKSNYRYWGFVGNHAWNHYYRGFYGYIGKDEGTSMIKDGSVGGNAAGGGIGGGGGGSW